MDHEELREVMDRIREQIGQVVVGQSKATAQAIASRRLNRSSRASMKPSNDAAKA